MMVSPNTGDHRRVPPGEAPPQPTPPHPPQTGSGSQNPFAPTFQFHPPSDFAPTRRALGGIRCATINVQGISNPAKREAVHSILQAWDLDILALQETWLRE